VATSWDLGFEFHDPQRITLQLPGDVEPTTFWYMLFVVRNDTGREVDFYPSFELVTDTLRVVEGGDNISASVYEAIAKRHEKEYPFFAPPWKVTGTILQGEENARTSAVVFRGFDKEASAFKVYISGLSGDLVRVANPNMGASDSPGMAAPYFILRRTLAIHYGLPGDPVTRSMATPVRRDREWVMR